MIIENINSDGLRHEFRVVFDSDEVENEINGFVIEKAKTFKMHGFRPGHVPLEIVKNSVGGSVVKDAFEALVSKACTECTNRLESSELALTPSYRFENNYESGKNVSVIVAVETAPSFELKPFECEMTRIVPKVPDEVIIKTRDDYLKLSPILEKAPRDREIQRGDEVTYLAKCYNKGGGSKKKSFQDKLLLPEEFGENADLFNNFLGKKIGEKFDFVMQNQDNLKYEITIKSIRCPVGDLSIEEIANRKGIQDIAQFDAEIKRGLEKNITDAAFVYHKSQILEYLGDQYDFDIPPSIFNHEMRNLLAEIKRDTAEEERRTGEKQELGSDEELRTEYADVAKKRVVLAYVLNRFASKEKIFVHQLDLQNAIMEEINRTPHLANSIMDFYSKNPDAVTYRRAEIIERKVVDFLMMKSKTNEVEKTMEEVNEIVNDLFKEDDESEHESSGE
ncbi:MAG: hypothetical protein LBI20_02310 [Holosporales bacterium]|jgi:trigger factor|nr:hypothetical protein [Holosporales bacterium]